ncbi:hypothetical protein [Streptomyces sp. NPDC088915]|uniref:hypothetical protein n=1 Tax=Streptomyces sp. NPDC088915 TaxID=3365912 RepID=UPI0038269ED6
MTSIPPAAHADGTPLSVQLFTISDTGHGPYVGLPVTSVWDEDTAHLFTRETAVRIVANAARDDQGTSGTFAADGTLTLQWTETYNELGRIVIVTPDAHGRYLIGGLWPWAMWGDDGAPHTAGQAAFARGATEYRQADDATSLPEPLDGLYRQGRREAQLLSRECPGHREMFDVDPSRTPLVATQRPTNAPFKALPPGASEASARVVAAREVKAGDLVLASFDRPIGSGRITRSSAWMTDPYVAAPRPWNPWCVCTPCQLDRDLYDGEEPEPRVVFAVPEGRRTACDMWEPDEPLLVVPAALLAAPA